MQRSPVINTLTTYPDELSGRELIDHLKEQEPDVPIVSHSQIMAWDRCEFQWQLGYVENWTPREKSQAMELGTLIHEDLAAFYTAKMRRLSHYECRDAAQDKISEHFNRLASNDSNLEMLAEEAWLVFMYIDNYAPSNDAEVEVLGVEEHFIVPLYTPLGHRYYLQGYVDLRTLVNEQLWLWDHKSSTKRWSNNEILMDSQQPLYAAAYTESNMPVFGSVINELNTYKYKDKSKVPPDKLFFREFNYYGKRQLENILLEVGRAVDEMILARANGSQQARRRLRRDCSYCRYQDPCLLNLKGASIEDAMRVNFIKKGEENQEGELNGETLNIFL